MNGRSDTRSSGLIPVLAYSILTVLIFGTQYAARRLDDNRLTSWQWVFARADPSPVAALIFAGLIVSFICSRSSVPDRRPLLFLSVLSFFAASLFWGEPEVIVDAARYFSQAKHLELSGVSFFFKEWGGAIPAWTDLPLFPFLYGLLFAAFGEARLWVQIFTTALFSLTVLCTYLVGRTLWDEDVGLSGGLLLLGMPYLFTQVPLMLVDVGTMCCFMFAVLMAVRALRTGSASSLAIAPVALLLVVLSKYSAWLLLSVLAVLFPVELSAGPSPEGKGAPPPDGPPGEARSRRSWRRSVLARGVIIAAGAALLAVPVLLALGDVVPDQVGLLLSYQGPGLRRWGESFVSTFFFQVHPIITATALFSLSAAARKRDLRYAVILWPVLLLLVMRVERVRYLMTVFPLLALMAAYGLREIHDRPLRRFVALCAVASSLVVALGAYLPFLKTVSIANLKAAGEYLDTLDADAVEVHTLPDKHRVLNTAYFVPLLDLYTRKTIRYDYDPGPLPPPDEVRTSGLRFTWEYRNPRYYARPEGPPSARPDPILVISSEPGQRLPEKIRNRVRGLSPLKTFENYEGVFQSRTAVTVYRPASKRESKSL